MGGQFRRGREALEARDRIEQRTCRHDGNPWSHGPRTARKPRNRHPWTLSSCWEVAGATSWLECAACPVWDGLANNKRAIQLNNGRSVQMYWESYHYFSHTIYILP